MIKTKPSRYTKQWKTYYPKVTSLKDKAKLTGIPESILRKVYEKGVAAWRTGHRPGAGAQQWGHARVNSFIMKGKTYYTADAYLVKECQKHKRAKIWFNNVKGLCDLNNRQKFCN